MMITRVPLDTPATLTITVVVDDTLADVDADLAVTVTRLDGTAVDSGTGTHTGTGTYTYILAGQAALDALVVEGSGTVAGRAVTQRDTVEVVGGFLFGLAEARSPRRLNLDATRYPNDVLAPRRVEVEQEAEAICRRAFVPRFARDRLSGSGTSRLATRWPELRTLRAVSVAGVAWLPADVAAVGLSAAGYLVRADGALWPAGAGNVTVEYEHGLDVPPEEIRTAAMLRLRSRLNQPTSGIPDRAQSYTTSDGATFRLTVPDRWHTGIPDVDGPYQRWQRTRRAAIA